MINPLAMPNKIPIELLDEDRPIFLINIFKSHVSKLPKIIVTNIIDNLEAQILNSDGSIHVNKFINAGVENFQASHIATNQIIIDKTSLTNPLKNPINPEKEIESMIIKSSRFIMDNYYLSTT